MVTRFAPAHLARSTDVHTTFVKFSPNGSEILTTYNGEHIYLFDVYDRENFRSFTTSEPLMDPWGVNDDELVRDQSMELASSKHEVTDALLAPAPAGASAGLPESSPHGIHAENALPSSDDNRASASYIRSSRPVPALTGGNYAEGRCSIVDPQRYCCC